MWIDNGALYGQPVGHGAGYWVGRVSAVRWNGKALVPVDTSARYPALTDLDLSAVAAKLPCRGLAPRTQLRLAFDPQLKAVDGDRQWQLDREQYGGIWDDLGRTGQPFVLTDIACAPSSSPEFENAQDRVILLDLTPAGWQVLAVIDTGPVELWEWQGNTGSTVTLRQIEVTGEDHNVDYVWNGTEFVFPGRRVHEQDGQLCVGRYEVLAAY